MNIILRRGIMKQTSVYVRPNTPAFPVGTIAFFLVIGALVIAVLSSFSAAAEPAGGGAAAQPVSDEQLDAALSKAFKTVESAPNDFVAAMQSVAGRFETLEPATKTEDAQWQSVSLNERGKHLDAIRFTVPQGEKRDLVWAFAAPASMDRWYILPASGKVGKGFTNFWQATPRQAFGGPHPQLDAIVQTLPAANLEPGREYVLWFRFKDQKPATVWVSLATLPKAAKAYDQKMAMTALGLPRAVPSETQKPKSAND